MRKKIKVKIGNKTYKIGELTLGGYYLALTDIEQFIEDIFLEFNKDIPNIDEDQTRVIIEKLFNIEDLEIKTLFEKKKDNSEILKDFHIKVGFFMKFFGNSYLETMGIPLEIFNNLLEDIKIIAGEEKYDPKRNESKVEKRKLKNLLSNLK